MNLIDITKIYPHPDNPRKNVGDVSELADSIKENGILQNLTVVPFEDGYRVIIGHRRLAASKQAGLTELPCVVREMTPQEQVKTMLMENMQRSDLTVYEQAQGFQMMLDMGETVESIAKDSGFSKSTVYRRVKLLELDAEKFRKSESRGATLQDYVELEKIEDIELKNKVLDTIGTANFKNELMNAIGTEKHLKRIATWKAEIATFATEIEQRDYIGEEHVPMDYVSNFGRWTRDTTVERPKDADTVRYYYRVSDTQIDLYKDHQEVEKSAEDIKREEERKENIRRWEELTDIAERHYDLRFEFVQDFGKAKKHFAEIARFAAVALMGDGDWGRDMLDTDMLSVLLNIDVDEDTSYTSLKSMVAKAAVTLPEYALLVCAYVSVDAPGQRYCARTWNSSKQLYDIEYCYNSDLDRLYSFLTALGYEMSDEEKALQDGSHELFKDGHNESEGQ